MWRRTFLPLGEWSPAAGRNATGHLLEVNVVVPVLVKGIEYPCKGEEDKGGAALNCALLAPVSKMLSIIVLGSAAAVNHQRFATTISKIGIKAV